MLAGGRGDLPEEEKVELGSSGWPLKPAWRGFFGRKLRFLMVNSRFEEELIGIMDCRTLKEKTSYSRKERGVFFCNY